MSAQGAKRKKKQLCTMPIALNTTHFFFWASMRSYMSFVSHHKKGSNQHEIIQHARAPSQN